MDLYTIELTSKDIRLLNKCMKIAKEELKEVVDKKGIMSNLAIELNVDMTNLCHRITEQITEL